MARLADVHTVEQLTALIDSIEVEVASGRTLLYSGHLGLSQGTSGTAIKSHDVAALLAANHPQFQIIDELPIGKFLDINPGSAKINELLVAKLDELFQGNQEKITAYLARSSAVITRSAWSARVRPFAADAGVSAGAGADATTAPAAPAMPTDAVPADAPLPRPRCASRNQAKSCTTRKKSATIAAYASETATVGVLTTATQARATTRA